MAATSTRHIEPLLPAGVAGPTTHYGATSSAYTLNRVTAAQRRTTSSVAMPVAFGAVVAGQVSTPTRPPLATLKDSFSTGVDKTTVWNDSSAGTVWDATGQRATLPAFGSDVPGNYLSTSNQYDLTGSSLAARITPAQTSDGHTRELDMVVYAAGADRLLIGGITGGVIGSWYYTGGAWTPVTDTPHDPVAHAYWRIRETGGTVYFDTSPDGQAWTNTLGSVAAPFAVTSVVPAFESYGLTGGPTLNGYVDNVNTATVYGALAAPFAFNAAVAGQRKAFAQVAAPFTFSKAVAGQRKTFGATATPLTFTKAVAGTRRTFGALAAPYTFAAVTQAVRKALGALTAPFTFSAATAGQKRIRGTANLHVVAVGVTHYGQVTAPFGFGAVVQGRRRTTSSITAPFVFSAAHAGSRKAFGAITAPFVFGEVTQGRRRTTSSLVAPFVFTKDVRAQRRTTGALTAPFVFGAVTASRKQYARLTAPFVFGEVTAGRKHTRSSIAMPITFGAVTAGIGFTGAKTWFGATAWTITFGEITQGRKKTYGVVARPTTWAAVVQGKRTTKSQIAAVYTWSSTTQAKRKTHAQIAMPIQWLAVTKGISTVGIQTYYGVVTRPILFSATTQARRRTFATTATPITFSAFTKGMLMASILNYADDVRWGTIQADRVLVGTEEVWTP